jgi:hypothetical protein
VKSGDISISPLRRGPKEMISKLYYKNFYMAAESYVVINQNNGNMRKCMFRRLCARIEKVVCGIDAEKNPCLAQHLLHCVLKYSLINLKVSKAKMSRTGEFAGPTTETSRCGLITGIGI